MSSDFRAANISRYVKKSLDQNQSVLDIGCGSCVLTHLLLKNGFDVTSSDNSLEMLEMAREFLREEGLPISKLFHLNIDECASKFGAKFDQVVCLDVIEHIDDDNAAVESIFSLIKPGGRLILSVPALSFLYGPKDERVGHYRRYDRRNLIELISSNKFKLDNIRYWNLIGVPITVVALKILKTEVDESMRFSNRSLMKKIINKFLWYWFRFIENMIRPPFGLTLIVEATKPIEKPVD